MSTEIIQKNRKIFIFFHKKTFDTTRGYGILKYGQREWSKQMTNEWTVSYTYYNKYQNLKQFANETAAKKFFWYIQKQKGVTRTEIRWI